MSNTNVSTEAVIASENNQLDCDFFPDDIKTIKAKNANNELSKTELLKLLCYMEGEIQARDICIAVLKVCLLIYFIHTRLLWMMKCRHCSIFRNDPLLSSSFFILFLDGKSEKSDELSSVWSTNRKYIKSDK